jgi:hypothetical protein
MRRRIAVFYVHPKKEEFQVVGLVGSSDATLHRILVYTCPIAVTNDLHSDAADIIVAVKFL